MTSKADLEAIGIDFGTSGIKIAASVKGCIDVEVRFPTTVKIDNSEVGEGRPLRVLGVGVDPWKNLEAWRHFKLDMGLENASSKRCYTPQLFKRYPAPHHLAAICLREGLKKLFSELGYNEPPSLLESATVSVPAMWNLAQRQATVFAARVAGIKEVNLIEEPVAAYLHVAARYRQLREPSSTIHTLVFDFGGGTCDMVIIRHEPEEPPVPVDRRKADVGGQDIDEAISYHWQQYLSDNDPNFRALRRNPVKPCCPEENNKSESIPPGLWGELLNRARTAKHETNPVGLQDIKDIVQDPLHPRPPGSHPPVPISYKPDGEPEEFSFTLPELTREEFDQIIERIWHRPDGIEDKLDLLLKSPKIDGDPRNIDYVILAGGSSYIRPVIANLMKKLDIGAQNREKRVFLLQPEEAVAQGACRFQRDFKQGDGELIQPTAAFTTLLEVPHDAKETTIFARIPADLSRQLGRIKILRQEDGRTYYVLGRRNEMLSHFSLHRLVLPVPGGHHSVDFRIFQTTLSESDAREKTYSAPPNDLVDEITIPVKAGVILLLFYYSFDRFGGFKRFAVTYPRLSVKRRLTSATLVDPDNIDEVQFSRYICFGGEKE